MTPPANRLINETSPYLLQHAHNPVDWSPWGEEALTRAVAEDKPIIVSIGYSACHWCHVMERESFENPAIAKIMNQYFVPIKIDREERPDVDQIYMDAVQAMGLQGGWPLNVFLTADQKPFYGGTYFPPQQWGQLLQNVAQAYENNRDELAASAEKFKEALNLSAAKKYGLEETGSAPTSQGLKSIFTQLARSFDTNKGGNQQAPKFPMPSIWQFLLCHTHETEDQAALNQLLLTLDQMAYGGIYDQIGGGFARYSVDEDWLVPHFEKMLYDNGQLVSLYAQAFQLAKNDTYREVVYETIAFIVREMTSSEGGFYSALDADSEGEEGKFYVWSYEEFEEAADGEVDWLSAYYQVTDQGNWEGKNILNRTMSDQEFAEKHGLDPIWLKNTLTDFKYKLLQTRAHRVRPGLDDKILTGWNALMLKGLVDAYAAFGESKFLDLALENASFISKRLSNNEGLWRTYKNGKANISAYLEDYALVIQAFIGLYQVTFEEKWLYKAQNLASYVMEHFYDPKEQFFFYTDATSEALIARKKEFFDNVIPASNSVMATNLYLLGHLLDRVDYLETARIMLGKMSKLVLTEPRHLSNWALLYYHHIKPLAEVAIVGPDHLQFGKELSKHFVPRKVLVGTETKSDLPLLEGREASGPETTIYVCFDRSCKLPVTEVKGALQQLRSQESIK
ncbi:MAG: thioredoxin domain-containing protein [Cyclobacteriaceae bacterium]